MGISKEYFEKAYSDDFVGIPNDCERCSKFDAAYSHVHCDHCLRAPWTKFATSFWSAEPKALKHDYFEEMKHE